MSDQKQTYETTRVIFKNLPKHCSEKNLKDWILNHVNVRITDVRVPKVAQNKSRRIGFVGVYSSQEATKLIEQLDRAFLDTARIRCSAAFPPGSQNIPRPWSRYAPGSSAYEKSQKIKQDNKEKRNERKKRKKLAKHQETNPLCSDMDTQQNLSKNSETLPSAVVTGNATLLINSPNGSTKRMKLSSRFEPVAPTKAGMASLRHHVEFDELDDHDSPRTQTRAHQSQSLSKQPVTTSNEESFLKETEPLDEDPFEWLKNCSQRYHTVKNVGKENLPIVSVGESKNPSEKQEDPLPYLEGSLEDENNAQTSPKDKKDNTQDDDVLIGETGRLLILNLPYTVTESEILHHFRPFGEISNIHLCLDEKKINSVGRAFVQFAFPEHAVKAAAELHMSLFQGRIIRVKGAHLPPTQTGKFGKEDVSRRGKGTSSYKRKHEEKLKQNAENTMTWNLLYVSANSALHSLAANMSCDKKDIIGWNQTKGDDSVAARVALAETELIHQTKEWLYKEGISASVFERTGLSLLASQPVYLDEAVKRSHDTIIAKHLPPHITQEELFELFAKYGDLVRCSLAPSKTVAVIQFLNDKQAKYAFAGLAFTRIRNLPLFLEWAPESIFTSEKTISTSEETIKKDTQKEKEVGESLTRTTDDLKHLLENLDPDSNVPVSLFVKNLNFNTTEASLMAAFQRAEGFLEATIMKKKLPIKSQKNQKDVENNESQPKELSMGYGFVKFDSKDSALSALKRFQNLPLDDHLLELSLSRREARDLQDKETKKAPVCLGKITNKLTVRNLAFQATKKDLRRLFEAFGNVLAVRIPKKADGTSRGYGFVEFISSSEALNALEALQHTHLYGRKLVLEFSNADKEEKTPKDVK